MLLSAANNCDSQFVPAHAKSQRRVHTTEIGNHDFNQDSPSEITEDIEYNIDASASTLLASVTNRSNYSLNSYLSPEDFNSLNPQAKDAWHSLPNNLKAMIIKNRSNSNRTDSQSKTPNNFNKSNYRTAKPPSYANKPFANANLHELITELIAQNNVQEGDSDNNGDIEQGDETTMLVNSTSATKINLGDIRNLMSASNTQNINPLIKKTAFKSDIMIDGETFQKDGESYQKANVRATYQLSKTNRSSLCSLVDRGANGGAAGNDARVIEKHPDKTFNMWGIDNHKVPSIPMVIAGGVTSTTNGEVILIMHQYAYHPKCAAIYSSA